MKKLRVIINLIIITLLINLLLGIITTVFHIDFLKPTDLIEAPRVFYTVPIGKYLLQINQTLVNTMVLMLLIILILYFGTRNLSIDKPSVFQLILEEYYRFVDSQFLANYGKYKEKFRAFFAALFAFILFLNLSIFIFPFVVMTERHHGKLLIKPFFRTATADLNTTFGLALLVAVIFITVNIRRQGISGFLKELSRPFIFMFPLNVIGEIAKPLNIAIRLFGNMFAGLVIIGVIYAMSLNNVLSNWTFNLLKGSFSFAVIWPAFLQLYLDLFIGILQAFIFTTLSSVYIEQSLIGEE